MGERQAVQWGRWLASHVSFVKQFLEGKLREASSPSGLYLSQAATELSDPTSQLLGGEESHPIQS